MRDNLLNFIKKLKKFLFFFRKQESKEQKKVNKSVEIEKEFNHFQELQVLAANIVSLIASSYPSKFISFKVLVKEYADLLDSMLEYRITGDYERLVNKLQDFLLRSAKQFFDEDNAVKLEANLLDFVLGFEKICEKLEKDIDADNLLPIVLQTEKKKKKEFKKVEKEINEYLERKAEELPDNEPSLNLKEQISEALGELDNDKGVLEEEREEQIQIEVLGKNGEVLAFDSDIEKIAGIGKSRARKLRREGINTVSDYREYLQLKEGEKQNVGS